MSGLTFTLRAEPDQRLDLSGLTPAGLSGLSLSQISRLAIGTTREAMAVGDVFDVSGEAGDDIRFSGGSNRFDRVGEALSGGSLHVEGDVGQRLGRAMSGGSISVSGSAGPFAGSGMRGGTLRLSGDAGDDLGAPLVGETVGLSGGSITVEGSAGARAGDRMRRGTIVVRGDAGRHAGARMVAGTLLVGGRAGASPGVLMKRGTLVLVGGTEAISATFVDNGPADLIVLGLLARAFAAEFSPSQLFDGRPMRRLAGDTAVSSLGEVFLPV